MNKHAAHILKGTASVCSNCQSINFFIRDVDSNELPIVIQCTRCGNIFTTYNIIKRKVNPAISQATGEWAILDKPVQEKSDKSLRQQLEEGIRYISNISVELAKWLMESELIIKKYKQEIIDATSPKWERMNFIYDVNKKELAKFIEFPFCVIRMVAYDEFIGNNSFLVLMPKFIYIKIGIEVSGRLLGYHAFIVNKYSKLSFNIPLGIVGVGDEIEESLKAKPNIKVTGRKIFGADVSIVQNELWIEKDIDHSDDNVSLRIKSYFGYYKWCLRNGINPYDNLRLKLVTDAREEINLMLTDEQLVIADLLFKYYRINISGDIEMLIPSINRIIALFKPAKIMISDDDSLRLECGIIKRRVAFDGFINPDNDYSLIILNTMNDPMDERELEYLCEVYHGPIINITDNLVLDTYTDNIQAFNMYALCQKSYQFGAQEFDCIANSILTL